MWIMIAIRVNGPRSLCHLNTFLDFVCLKSDPSMVVESSNSNAIAPVTRKSPPLTAKVIWIIADKPASAP